ncbi:MAG TPA: hypothetical protein DEB40_09490 [Elusimicrobia bacterium]|nr:hypothetical protein [Elusimicrobiota bacterium]HBT61962.1 hypothetical protein [Elusimicrobiota bacterium]
MRRQFWAPAALTLASAAVLSAVPAQYLGRQQDDILYVITSHALANGGYRLFTSPGLPPLTMIMPGFPMVLMPITLIFGEFHPAYQIFCGLILAGLPWLLWRWLRRRLGEAESVLIALIFATSPIVLSQAGTIMSEGAYTCLAVLFLAAAEARSAPARGALLLALTQVRPAGISLFPAALAEPWRTRDWKAALKTALPALLGLSLWWLWSFSVSGGVDEAREWRLSYAGHPWLRPLAVALDNARFYLNAWGANYVPASGSLAAALLLAALAGLGAWRLRREESARPALLMLAGALLMHLFWAWQYERYLIPILPWLLWLAAAGARRRAPWLLAGLLALQLCLHAPRRIMGDSAWTRPELSRTYEWIRGHSSPGDAIASPLYVRDGFLAARPSVPLPDTDDPGRFAELLARRRVRFVITQENLDVGLSQSRTATIQFKLDRALALLQDPGRFRLVYARPEESSRVYELR